MPIKKWILDGHPQRYHVVALALAILALSTTFVTTILAEDSGSTTTTTSITAPTACSYTYTSWGVCQSNGTRTRSVSGASPSGCVSTTAPVLVDNCTYSSTTTTSVTAPTACSYTYTSWGVCQSNGTRTRSVSGASPSGCVSTTAPVLVDNCTYSSTTTTSVTAPTACSYTYTSWSVCQSNGKRVRTLNSKLPAGCQEYTNPVLEQSCIYDSTAAVSSPVVTTTNITTTSLKTSSTSTTGTETTVETVTSVTPLFSFVNVNEGMIIRGVFEIKGQVQGAEGVEYYLVPAGSNTYKYIGSAVRASDTNWSLRFQSTGFPNGEFYLRAKIKNKYGEYGGGQKKVKVANDNGMTTEALASGEVFTPFAMSAEKKSEMLQAVEAELMIPKDTTTDSAPQTPDQQKMHIFSYCESNPEKCFSERDSDNDGLSDIDEIRYGTDLKGADSDFDGFIDGDEVKNGFDPVKYSGGDQSDRIIFENPKVAGETKDQIYAVEQVELKEVAASETTSVEKKIKFTGKGLPNSFVTIYIYSDPIVLTVKTDSEGNWVYELDKELEDGEHEAYVAITDNTGKITGKSNPFPFVKTAQAVTVIPTAAAKSETILPVTQNRAERDILILVSIVATALVVALVIIGLMRHRHHLVKEEILK